MSLFNLMNQKWSKAKDKGIALIDDWYDYMSEWQCNENNKSVTITAVNDKNHSINTILFKIHFYLKNNQLHIDVTHVNTGFQRKTV